MSFNFPHAIPTLIPTDTNVRATRVSTIYPTQVLGPYTTWKLPARVATTANITLSGLQTIDGVTVVAGDRVLVKNQITVSENGIYVVFSSSTATDFWLRANDLQDGSSAANVTIFVNEGTVSADLMYICTNNSDLDIVGTNNLVFTTYGDVSSISPGGNNTDVQYNNNGVFGGSDIFTFSPTLVPSHTTFPIDVLGTVTLGQATNLVRIARITGQGASSGSGLAGGTVALTGGAGDGVGAGGSTRLIAGYSTGGQGGAITLTGGQSAAAAGGAISITSGPGGTSGGNMNINGGSGTSANGGDVNMSAGNSSAAGGGSLFLRGGAGTTSDGNITLTAPSSSAIPGNVQIITNSITTYFKNGGVAFTKDTGVGMTIANLGAPPTITSTSRQGIITITNPSAVANGTSITITVNDVNVLNTDIIQVCVQEFNTGGTGIPMVLVSSITFGVGFTIQLYNIGAATFSASEMKISFIMM